MERYRRFRALFDAAFSGGGLIRHAVPYAGASLPAYWLPAAGQRPSGGAVLIHGGFDSLIEEFYPIWQRIAMAGFDVVAFEGPGQGGARALSGLTFDHDWERLVPFWTTSTCVCRAGRHLHGRILGIARCGVGTAHRSRGRVATRFRLALPVTGGYARPGPDDAAAQTADALGVRARARLIPTLQQIVDHTYLVDGHDPIEVVDWFLGMNADHLGSAQVTQDVLLMCGEHDSFQPPSLTRAQAKALTAARSVTVRMFTRAEDADQHCQIGNIGLACRVLTTWLRNTSPEPTAPD